MCRFIETIRFQDGHYPLLAYHQLRLNKAFLAHFPGCRPHHLEDLLPNPAFKGRYKVRVVYNGHQSDMEFSEYHLRPLKTIKLLRNDQIEYAHKYENREDLEHLFDQRGEADEILIIKNGLVTDSFYGNPAFWDGDQWYVPSTFLLNGVRRQSLINEGLVVELKIREEDLSSFQKVSLVNAMVDLGERELPMENLSS